MWRYKKYVSMVLVLCFIIGFMTPNANAVGISKKSKIMYSGDTFVLSITGKGNVKKWSSTNANVAVVNSKGKVTAKSKGKAIVSAKVGNRTVSCKITVKNIPAKKMLKNIEHTFQDTGVGVVVIAKNNNKIPIELTDCKMIYYDSEGKILEAVTSDNGNCSCLESKQTCALYFEGPENSKHETMKYNNFKMKFNYGQSDALVSDVEKIKVDSDFGSDNVTAKVKNNSKYDFNFVMLTIVYYDVDGNAIGFDRKYADCENSKSTDYITFQYPIDLESNVVNPASYKIYVNEAFAYY